MSAESIEFDSNDFDLDKMLLEFAEQQQNVSVKNAEYEALKIKVAQLAYEWDQASKAKSRLELEIKHDAVKVKNTERAIEKAKRLEHLKVEQTRLAEEFAKSASELDELTKNAVWRTGVQLHDGKTAHAKDYQIEGAKRLAVARRGICADKRGLGKTLTSIAWGDMVGAKRILVLAPNDVVSQFEEEIRTWAPDRTIFSLRGMPKSQRDLVYPLLNMVEEFTVTLNYEAWRKDKTIIDDLVKAGIDTVICDEAHRVKSSDKVTARGVFQVIYRPNWCPTCSQFDNFEGPWEVKRKPTLSDPSTTTLIDLFAGDGLWTHSVCGTVLESTVKNVLAMTGTPILNKPQEMFSLLFMVDRNQFPSEKLYLKDYCYSYAPNRWKFLTGGVERLAKRMSGFFVQRNRDDVGSEVPPPAITIHELEKDKITYKKQYEAERIIQEQAALLLQDGTRKDIFFVLEMILRERQCMVWPAGIKIIDPETKEVLCNFDVEESQKLDAVVELLEELCEEEERVIIFSQFKPPLYEIRRRLVDKNISVAMATGDQDKFHKEYVRMDFDLKTAKKGRVGALDGPKYQVCLATYKAFGTGINLNAARHMILPDEEWNPGMEDQAIGRIDRMNSEDQANVHIFRVKKSVDDFMAGLIEMKRGIVEGFETASVEEEMRNYFK